MKIELFKDFFNELKLVIFFIFVLNVLDGVLTIISVSTGRALEVNPLMAYLIHYHPVLFMVCKQLLVYLGSFILWRFRENILSIVSIFGIFLMYYINLFHHLRIINIGFLHGLIN